MFEILSVCKGGGYRYARTNPPHPRQNSKGLYPLHRVLAENKLGRLLNPGEIVHHKDHNKGNDAPVNLDVLSNVEHSKLHAKAAPKVGMVCANCGLGFLLQRRDAKRRGLSGRRVFCSKDCDSVFHTVEKVVHKCSWCEKEIFLKPGKLRARLAHCATVLGLCCSKTCARKFQHAHK